MLLSNFGDENRGLIQLSGKRFRYLAECMLRHNIHTCKGVILHALTVCVPTARGRSHTPYCTLHTLLVYWRYLIGAPWGPSRAHF